MSPRWCAAKRVCARTGWVSRISIAVCLFVLTGLAAQTCAAVEIGSPSPDFHLPRLGADTLLRLTELRGKIVLVDFWASWCGPCRESLPQYEKLYTEYPRSDFEIVAINLDEDLADAKKFLAAHPVSYPIALDPAGNVPKAFGLVGMPTSYLLDRNGVVRMSYQGFKTEDLDRLRQEIHRLSGVLPHAS